MSDFSPWLKMKKDQAFSMKEEARNKELADQARTQGLPIRAHEYEHGGYSPYSDAAEAVEEKKKIK